NWGRAEKLVRNGQDFLPSLTVPNQEAIAQTRWMGHRPSTPDTLPVISASPHHSDVFFAFGHGHLGLTAGAVTGDMIAELATGQVCSVDPKPFRIDRF
ncbi:MAG: FAD-binding oxidoreductase, partial [Pseudomonadota bacterium]